MTRLERRSAELVARALAPAVLPDSKKQKTLLRKSRCALRKAEMKEEGV